MAIRIGIDGPPSSGKTSLWTELRNELSLSTAPFVFVPEMSRLVAPRFGVRQSEHWPSLLADHQRLARFFSQEIELLRLWEDTSANCIVDSSVFMIVTYIRVFLDEVASIPEWPAYDVHFFCKPLEMVFDDGFRFTTEQSKVARTYLDVAKEAGIKDRVVRLAPNENRLSKVLTHPKITPLIP